MDCSSLLALADVTDGSVVELAQRYRLAVELVDELTNIAAGLEMELAARMEEDSLNVLGVGVLNRRAEKRSTWKDEYASGDFRRDVGQAVVRKVSLDIATGELDPVKRNIAMATVDTLFDVIPAFSSIKSNGRRLGITPEEYRTVSTVYRVSIVEAVSTIEEES